MIPARFAGDRMRRFVEGTDRGQSTLFPECLGDWISEDNPVRVIDVFVDELDLAGLGFNGVDPEATGRPSYHPSVLLKLYIYGYLNRIQSSRRLEREAGRNVEVMWLTERLAPDHKTIADFRKDNGTAIRKVCARFVALCRMMGLLTQASVAIDGSKFKAVNNRDKNFTRAKMDRRMAQIEESVGRYLQQLDTADRQEPSEALKTKTSHLKEKIAKLKEQMHGLEVLAINNSSALSSFLLSAKESCCAVEKGPNEPFALSVICLSVTVNDTAACIKTRGPRNGKTLKCCNQPELRIFAGILT